MYWDPLPTVAASANQPVPELDGALLPPPEHYLLGKWAQRDWRNAPGPFYGAETDSCWTGRLAAPDHVVYEDEQFGEVVFRQPRDAQETHRLLSAAWQDPFRGYAGDGDEHWTLELIREWWADRARLAAWIEDLQQRWSVNGNEDEQEAAAGLRAYADYLTHGLADHLREYAFWLENRRSALPTDPLPDLA
ncbi:MULTISPECIES: ferredoxin [unclassified Crossiella]|uniref:ferredoxin n=1 Tax=unclassified Crossiella TaxID=2620835 RepID=UPI001FFFA003|nr:MULTISPECIES: ferredoxin [unclassified Crossiella]MCK2243517.1 ferredoxin [Crossiella sp. S99.2]MCK2257375.1 ferredoxin [Crossiella sp. S99.1]